MTSWRHLCPNISTLKLLGSLVVTSHTETLNCDISSLENDTEMVDHSMNYVTFELKIENDFYFFRSIKKGFV